MSSAFHQLCPRYNRTLTPTAPTAIRLLDLYLMFPGRVKRLFTRFFIPTSVPYAMNVTLRKNQHKTTELKAIFMELFTKDQSKNNCSVTTRILSLLVIYSLPRAANQIQKLCERKIT